MNYNDDDSINNPDINDFNDPSESRIPNFPGQPPVFPGQFPNPPGQSPNVPGGSNLNIGPPPNFTPTKNSPGVKSLNQGTGGPQTKAVSPGSISFCLFKFTYIWERRGRNYWAYLLNVDRRSVSGLRWFRNTWVFFGLDLRQIDSFVCFRSSDTTLDDDELREDSSENNSIDTDYSHNNNLFFSKKEYSTNNVKNTYIRILKNIDISEEKNDYITSYIGEVDDNELTMKIPTKLHRNTSYRIVLEIKYPEKFSESLVGDFNKCANEAAENVLDILDEFREDSRIFTPLEVFSNSTKNIGKTIKSFSEEFHKKLKNFKLPREITRQIEFKISEEKVRSPWV
ncbi:MAG: hypothetical protein E6248_14710 [Clostridium sp.]|uniref:hypothetical protein n=1 Tax=Clostridium sp. TaxID=1506 RepID=UPI00290F1FCD|nr:hypothetical protein [Clostridium sp.]MDU5111691.1 hypothetical protein [Clostridium sp.]